MQALDTLGRPLRDLRIPVTDRCNIRCVWRTRASRRVTVSLDSLDDATSQRMNDAGFQVSTVLEGIEAARAAGLPVNVNCVVKRGVNEAEIVPLARRFRESGDTLRFIEYMDVGSTNGWRMGDVVPAAEIVAMLDRELGIEPLERSPAPSL